MSDETKDKQESTWARPRSRLADELSDGEFSLDEEGVSNKPSGVNYASNEDSDDEDYVSDEIYAENGGSVENYASAQNYSSNNHPAQNYTSNQEGASSENLGWGHDDGPLAASVNNAPAVNPATNAAVTNAALHETHAPAVDNASIEHDESDEDDEESGEDDEEPGEDDDSDEPSSEEKNELSELEQLQRDAAIEQARKDQLLEDARRDAFIGQVVARDYTIFKHIGEGQSSHIFTTKMVYTEGHFILKVLKKPDNNRTEVFRRAVRDMEDLEHTNIVKTRFYIESRDGDPCSMMEYFESVPLTEVLFSIKKIQAERIIILILLQIAAALEYAHTKGVIHGHLTPRDVLTRDTVDTIIVKITDFGLAELKDHSPNSPDWAYLSPERLKGAPPTEQSDVYALGVIGYQIISGFPPYNEKELKSNVDEEPLGLRAVRPDLKCGYELNQILRKAVEKNPGKRVVSMKEFKTRLIEIAEMFEGKRATTKRAYDKVPDMPFSAHLNEIKGVTEEDLKEEEKNKKPKKRSRRQQITKTFTELVTLKRNLYDQEQALAVRLAAAAAQGQQRRSPLSTVSRMFATIIISGVILTAAVTYALTHTKQLKDVFTTASIQLHKMLTPPPAPKKEEVPPPEMTATGKPKPPAARPGVPSQPATSTSAMPGQPPTDTTAAAPGEQPKDPAAPADGSAAQTGNNPVQTGNNPIMPNNTVMPNNMPAPAIQSQPPPTLITPATVPRKAPGVADKDRELYKQFRERMSRSAY